MLVDSPHVARVIARDPSDLFAHVTPDSSRRLLLAALDTFFALGFEAATTREIATRAQLSHGAVYVHYEAKLDLLQQILEIAHDAVWESVAEALEGVERPSRRLCIFAETFAAWHARNFKLGRVAQYQLPALPADRMDNVLVVRRRFGTLVRNELLRGVDEDGFDVPDLRGTTRAILSLGIDIVRWYSPERGISVEELAHLQGELVLRLVRRCGGAHEVLDA